MRRDLTAVGNVDSPLHAGVDRHGRLWLPGCSWSLTWWVRASDRWHIADEETGTAVSQGLLGDAPVVETGLRIPGGQAIHRAWAVVQGAHEWVVVEVEDRSREPVGVAVVVEGARRIAYDDGVVAVDGRPALHLPRRPSRFVDEPSDGGGEHWPGDRRDRRGAARSAFVFPVAHTALVRFALPLTDGAPPVDLDKLADADRVASGWRSHVLHPGAMRVELPDERLASKVAADRAALLIVGDDPSAPVGDMAAAAGALDRFGHHDHAGRSLPVLVGQLRRQRWQGAGRALVALAQHHRLAGTTLDEEHLAPVAEAAHKLQRRAADDPSTAAGQLAAAELLGAAGQPDAAEACRRLAQSAPAETELPTDHSLDPAARLDAVHAQLLAETDGGVALAPGYPDDWLGQGLEVHDAPTRFGRLSFAVRWHGARPALLWQLDIRSNVPGLVRLTAPRLDPTWHTDEPRGEALLQPVEPAGGLPGVVAPLPSRGGDPSQAPEGGTFG